MPPPVARITNQTSPQRPLATSGIQNWINRPLPRIFRTAPGRTRPSGDMDHGTVDDPIIGPGSWGPKTSPTIIAGPFPPAPQVESIRYGPEPTSRGRGQGGMSAPEPSIPVTAPPLT